MVELKREDDELLSLARRGRGVKLERPDGKKYVVCHVSKFNRADVVGMHKHIQREMKTTINEDIEPHKTALNYDLSGFDKKTMKYTDEIEKRLKERFKGGKAIRKDAVVMVGVIVSATPELFEGMSDEQERQYFQTAFDFLADRFGRENVISATVHKDEKTPHMHFNFVPLTADGRLSAKEIVNQKALLDLQENLPKELKEAGFEVSRGLPSKQTGAKHERPRDWKVRTAKNEFERAEHVSVAGKRELANAKQSLSRAARVKSETARRAESRAKRAERRERILAIHPFNTSNQVPNDRETHYGRGAENRVQDDNSESRSDLKNVDTGGDHLGNADRVRTKQDLALAFAQKAEEVKKSKGKKGSVSKGGYKM